MRNKRIKVSRWQLLVLGLFLIGSLFASPIRVVQAEELELEEVIEEVTEEVTEEYPSNEELFAGYVEQVFYGKQDIFGTGARENLSEAGKYIYDYLKEQCEKISSGEATNTQFVIDQTVLPEWNTGEYRFVWTAEELGVESITADNVTAVAETFTTALNEELGKVYYALQYDCPYELYWKGSSWARGGGPSYTENEMWARTVMVYIKVSVDYAPEDATNAYTADATKTAAATLAVGNALEIVEEYVGLSDYDKLLAYRDEIKDLVSYNDEAVDMDDSLYGNPWQMIWVFDGDPETNVVCEGYAKAFQYLCDKTEFNSDNLECYTVSGYLGGGGHRWNIVTMDDGKNYIVDVTNSDTGTVGQYGGLFLSGMTGTVEEGYTSSESSTVFSYRDETENIYGTGEDSILVLASEDYEPLFQVANRSLTLYNNLAVKFKVPDTLFTDGTYTAPYLVIDFGGNETILTSYTHDGERYVFEFDSIAPHLMTDSISYTLKATHDGIEYSAATMEYSIAEYCYNTLTKYSDDSYAELRTLLVDLLNYGTAAQKYMSYNTDDLANADLYSTEEAWGTAEAPELATVRNMAHATVTEPLATWVSGGLRLEDAIMIRYKLQVESTEGLSVKVVRESDGKTWTLTNFQSNGDGTYYVYFSGLNVAQMRDVVDATVYKNGIAVSDTFRYSVESYAYSKMNDSSVSSELQELLDTMMKYGDSAYNYVN